MLDYIKEVRPMINTKTLRDQYRRERHRMKQNETIGVIILTVLAVIFAIGLTTIIVRCTCLAIVALYNIS